MMAFDKLRSASSSGSRRQKRATTRVPLYEALENRQLFSTIVVNSTLDQLDPPGNPTITLRDAIARANVATSSTSILFSTSVFNSLKTILLDGSRLIIQNASAANVISITGPSAGVIINGNHASGDFVIWTNTTAQLSNLRITGGKSTNGAGVDSYGYVTLTNCTVTENSSPNGGGVYSSGSAFLLNDTISNNVGVTGGGIWNSNGAYLSLTDTTVSGNTGTYGGAIDNSGTGKGTVELHNATLSNNTATNGGGVYNYADGTVGLSNTIIAQNKLTSTQTTGVDVAGIFASRGYNLIGNVNGSSGWVSSDLTGTAKNPLNAKLNPLGDYGGPTYTMTLAAGSPALGAGLPSLISWEKTDQRGLPRIVGNKVDIGAIETQTPIATLPVPTVLEPGTSNSPGPVLTTLTPTFRWDAIKSGITGFQLNLYDTTASKGFSYTLSPTATSFNLPAGVLVAGDKYVWNLRVLNGTASGGPSTYLYFQAPATATLPIPIVLEPGTANSPGPVLTTLTPTFRWDAITSGITGFQLNLYNSTAGKSFSYTLGLSATSFTPPAGVILPGDKYVWNLRVLNGSASGAPSTYLYFQTPPASVLPVPVVLGPGSSTSPGPTVDSLTPTFTWKPVTGSITGLQLNLYNITEAKLVSYQINATATSFTVPTSLGAGDAFVWNLRSVDGSVTGTESAYLYFQTT